MVLYPARGQIKQYTFKIMPVEKEKIVFCAKFPKPALPSKAKKKTATMKPSSTYFQAEKKLRQRATGLFNKKGYSVRLIGDNNPMFILNDSALLPCLLNGNSLYFLKAVGSSEVLRKVDLFLEDILSRAELDELMHLMEYSEVYRLKDKSSGMYLIGFNSMADCREDDTEDLPLRFPVFARHNPVIYLNREKVERIQEEIKQSGYLIEVV